MKVFPSIANLQCNALTLNSHFPRALLHGSVILGGMGIPTQTHKTTKGQLKLNFFLYNVRRPSITQDKLEASILFKQLEAGTSQLFFLLIQPIWPSGYDLLCSPNLEWMWTLWDRTPCRSIYYLDTPSCPY